MRPQGTKYPFRKSGKVHKESGCDVMGDILNNCPMILSAIMKSSFITEIPEGIEDCLNQIVGNGIVLIASIEP